MIDRRWKCWNFVKYKLGKWFKNHITISSILLVIFLGLLGAYIIYVVYTATLPPEFGFRCVSIEPEPFNLLSFLPIAIIGTGGFFLFWINRCSP